MSRSTITSSTAPTVTAACAGPSTEFAPAPDDRCRTQPWYCHPMALFLGSLVLIAIAGFFIIRHATKGGSRAS